MIKTQHLFKLLQMLNYIYSKQNRTRSNVHVTTLASLIRTTSTSIQFINANCRKHFVWEKTNTKYQPTRKTFFLFERLSYQFCVTGPKFTVAFFFPRQLRIQVTSHISPKKRSQGKKLLPALKNQLKAKKGQNSKGQRFVFKGCFEKKKTSLSLRSFAAKRKLPRS